MELEQLRQLEAIEHCGTISAAAEHLHITQPSLSRSIKRLEADLGQELFTRTRNKAQLNEAGKLACQYAREMLTTERRMREDFDALARRQRTLDIGSVAPAPTWHLTARVVEYLPGTILNPEILSDDEVVRRLFDGSIHLGITRKPLSMPNLVSIPLMTESLSVCMPADHALAGRKRVTFEQLDGETFLIFEQIGFWMDVCRTNMPNAQIIVQKDREVFIQLTHSSNLLFFITDAPQNSSVALPGYRKVLPITDAAAHATFFMVARRDCPERVQQILDVIPRN